MQTKRRVDLDDFQRTAALLPLDTNGNIVAGAGTGKTTVLVARYMKLVEDDGIPPDRLLALTFTLKAAGEMRERVRAAMVARRPELASRLESGWIMNFHQFGYRFIQENAPALAIDPGIGVMSIAEFHRIRAVLRARFENGRLDGIPADFGGEPPPPTKLPGLFDTCLAIAQKCRANMIDVAELRRRCGSGESPAYLARVDLVVALVGAWEDELRRRNLLDFDDMIIIPTRALRDLPELRERYARQFDHVLVDEFQDTSRAQNEMLRAIAGDDFARVTVVGDVKQSIYRWRDARPENVTEFPADRAELKVNYRSVQAVLDLAHALVADEPLLAGFASPLEAERGRGAHLPVLFHPSVPEAQDEMEAQALADWIEYLLGRAPAPPAWKLSPMKEPLLPGQVAVLLRKFSGRSVTRSRIEAEFTRRGIPYSIVGGASTSEAMALQAWRELLLLLLPGPRAVNLLASLESKPFRVSEASLHELIAGGDRSGGTDVLLSDERIARIADAADRATVMALREGVAMLADAHRRLGFRAFLEWAIERTPLRLELAAAGVSGEAVDDLVRELHELADTLSRRGALDLATYLDHLGAELDARKFREDVDVRLPGDRVALMTIHQAKGLEFDAVAVPGVGGGEGQSETWLVSAENGIYFSETTGAPWNRGVKSAPEYAKNEEQSELEERCILYVALTRARDHLWVSSPLEKGEKKLKDATRPSFFTELLDAGLTRGIIVEAREPGPVREAGAAAAASATAQHELEAALGAWTALRDAAEARDLAPPPVTRALEPVTWESVARFAECPLAFSFDRSEQYDAARAEEPRAKVRFEDLPDVRLPKGVDPAAFGTYVHAVLERRTDMEMELDRALLAAAAPHDFGKHADVIMDLARERVRAAIAAGFAGPSAGAQCELPFAVRLERVLVHGVIDRLDDDGKDALITDYKLGVASPHHHFQLVVYAWAARRILGRDARARLVYLGRDPVDVETVETEHARIDATVTAMEAALTSGEFEARPGEVCKACVHRAMCKFALP
ncbi:MAG TPA: ATP-dependent DNA helicase [Candidatus Krumholzibacteria bacterium]